MGVAVIAVAACKSGWLWPDDGCMVVVLLCVCVCVCVCMCVCVCVCVCSCRRSPEGAHIIFAKMVSRSMHQQCHKEGEKSHYTGTVLYMHQSHTIKACDYMSIT